MNFYQECTAKTYSFLFIDPTLASDDLLHFGKTILEIIEKLIMKIFDRLDVKNQHKILIEKLQKYQQINFTGNLDLYGGTIMSFITEAAKQIVLDFSQGTVSLL